MARAKKEAALTPEERLQAALVPDWEWPYKLPENWCWVILGKTVSIKRGASPRPIKQYITEDCSGVNWIKIGDTDEGKYVSSVKEKITQEGAKKSVFVDKGTLLLSNSMSFGRPYILNVDGCIHDGWLAITPSDCVEKEFLYYALLASKWYFEQVAVGTAVRNLNSERVSDTPIPLPPLVEQQRIVDRIESLFAKLDEAKEKAQTVLDSFEKRKAAILHKAFTGELTANWRKKHGIGMESWETKPLGELTDIISSKRIYKEEYTASGVPFFRSSEVVELYDTGVAIPAYFISEERYNEIKQQYGVPQEGDLLVTSVGTIGKTWIVDGRKFYYKDGNLTQVKQCANMIMRYLQLYITSTGFADQISDSVAGSAYNALTIVKFKRISLPVPCIAEQTEIVRILDDLFAKEQQAKEAAEAVLKKIDLMKKAILARAFRGELGTNDPNDEPAVELLKKVLE